MRERAGAFVSLHRLGELRGCVGTFVPQRENVAEEIVENAIASATRDPRFVPVAPQELADLEVSVDILSTPEPVDSVDKLDPNQFGVIVTDKQRDPTRPAVADAGAGRVGGTARCNPCE